MRIKGMETLLDNLARSITSIHPKTHGGSGRSPGWRSNLFAGDEMRKIFVLFTL